MFAVGATLLRRTHAEGHHRCNSRSVALQVGQRADRWIRWRPKDSAGSRDKVSRIDLLPTPAIFDLIQKVGDVPADEMYRVFNMGVGFCVIVPSSQARDSISLGRSLGFDAKQIGTCTRDDHGTVEIPQRRLRSAGRHFESY